MILHHMVEKFFLPNQDICAQGEEGDCMYILHQGNAQVIKDDIVTPPSVDRRVPGLWLVDPLGFSNLLPTVRDWSFLVPPPSRVTTPSPVL